MKLALHHLLYCWRLNKLPKLILLDPADINTPIIFASLFTAFELAWSEATATLIFLVFALGFSAHYPAFTAPIANNKPSPASQVCIIKHP
jgi:hypothetical protein